MWVFFCFRYGMYLFNHLLKSEVAKKVFMICSGGHSVQVIEITLLPQNWKHFLNLVEKALFLKNKN